MTPPIEGKLYAIEKMFFGNPACLNDDHVFVSDLNEARLFNSIEEAQSIQDEHPFLFAGTRIVEMKITPASAVNDASGEGHHPDHARKLSHHPEHMPKHRTQLSPCR